MAPTQQHPHTAWDALAGLGRPAAFDAGDVLMREGDAPESLLLLDRGRVKVTRVTRRGPVAVLGFRGPGTILGEAGVLTGRPRTVTIAAIEPVAALRVAAGDFRHHLRTDPGLAVTLVEQLATWLQDADQRHHDQLTGDATSRVAARLLELGDDYGVDEAGRRRLALPLTQDELAGYVGASLEATARALRTLRAAGWLETARREIVLLDLEALRRRADA